MVFEAQNSNKEWYVKVAADVQNAIQCYCVLCGKKQRATTQTSLAFFSQEGR